MIRVLYYTLHAAPWVLASLNALGMAWLYRRGLLPFNYLLAVGVVSGLALTWGWNSAKVLHYRLMLVLPLALFKTVEDALGRRLTPSERERVFTRFHTYLHTQAEGSFAGQSPVRILSMFVQYEAWPNDLSKS